MHRHYCHAVLRSNENDNNNAAAEAAPVPSVLDHDDGWPLLLARSLAPPLPPVPRFVESAPGIYPEVTAWSLLFPPSPRARPLKNQR